MPEQVDVSIPIEVVQSVPALKTIFQSVLEYAILYWEVRIAYQDKIISSKHYNCPYLEVFGTFPIEGLVRAQDFEKAMFEKSIQIDSMPDSPEKTAMTNKKIVSITYGEV